MNFLSYLWYVFKCMAALAGIVFLFSLIKSVIRNDRFAKQKDLIELELKLRELDEPCKKCKKKEDK